MRRGRFRYGFHWVFRFNLIIALFAAWIFIANFELVLTYKCCLIGVGELCCYVVKCNMFLMEDFLVICGINPL